MGAQDRDFFGNGESHVEADVQQRDGVVGVDAEYGDWLWGSCNYALDPEFIFRSWDADESVPTSVKRYPFKALTVIVRPLTKVGV